MRHMDLRVTEDMLFCCSVSVQNCHPPYAHSHKDTCMHRKTQLCSLRVERNSTPHQMHAKYLTKILLRLAPHLPLSTSPLPYHPVRSRRWFFGCSCTAHCSQASAPVRFSPPSLHRPVRQRLYSSPCSSIIQGFCQDTCMHARAQQPLHTHRKMLMLVGRSSPLQYWGKEVASCSMQPCHAVLSFFDPSVIVLTGSIAGCANIDAMRQNS